MVASAVTRGIGNIILPWRFLSFAAVAIGSGVALLFIMLCAPLFRDEADQMRRDAKKNDASRGLLLGITAIVSGVIMVTVASVLMQQGARKPLEIALVLATLCLSWLFSNLVYALHYAHLYYVAGPDGKDSGGLEFPDTKEPDYWDFAYFTSCLGMTFQTSDTNITSRRLRRIGMFHGLAAFVFNLGVIAFSINVLGGGS
jgi:uncharacterized membrane protein